MNRHGLLLIGMALAALTAVAQDEPATNQTVITSDVLTFDYRRNIAIFEGNVLVVDPELTLRSDQLTVILEPGSEIKSVTAVGHVRIDSEGKNATCERAIYIARDGQILMTGQAVLRRSQDRLTGESIKFWLHEEKVLCTPGHLVIFPTGGGEKIDFPSLGPGQPGDERDDRKETRPMKAMPGR